MPKPAAIGFVIKRSSAVVMAVVSKSPRPSVAYIYLGFVFIFWAWFGRVSDSALLFLLANLKKAVSVP